MSSFVLLANAFDVKRACADLTAQLSFTKRRRALWMPGEILGMWVGPKPGVQLDVVDAFGFAGSWMMFRLEDESLDREALLDRLVASDQRQHGEPRFTPVFPRSTPEQERMAELARMRERHPREVGPPLLMNPMTGALEPVPEA